MYIKKYIYSSNEELMRNNEYSKINLNKVLEQRKIQLEIDLPYVEENDRITKLELKLILPSTMITKSFSVFRQIGTDNYNNDVLTVAYSEKINMGGIEYPTVLINLEHIEFSYDNKLIIKLYLDESLSYQERLFIEENDILQIYMETAHYQGIGPSSQVDDYGIGKSTVLVNRLDGKLMYNIHLLQTLHKKSPINLSLIGGNSTITTDEPIISNNLLFLFQNRITKLENVEEIVVKNNDDTNTTTIVVTKKILEVLDVFDSKNRYIYIDDIEDSKYKKLIIHDVVEGSEVYFNEIDGSYICSYKNEHNDDMFKLVYKNGSSKLYENSNDKTKLLKEIDAYNRETSYTWYGDKLASITNYKGETVTLEYYTNNYLSCINYNGGYVEFEYGENKLIINYYNNLGNLVDHLLLSYDNDKLVAIGIKRNNNKLLIEYINDKVSRVKMVERIAASVTPITPTNPTIPGLLSVEENTTLSNIGFYTDTPIYYYDYTYGDSYTKVTSFTNEVIYSYFDNFGRIKLENDDYGNIKNYDYMGNTEYLNSKSTSFCSKRILINNNSFEEDEYKLRHWIITPYNVSWTIANDGIYGKCLKIYKKSSETPKISQVIKNIELPLNKITFFAKKKGSGTVKIKCHLKKTETSDSEYNLEKTQEFTLYTTWRKYTLDLSSVTNEEGVVNERELLFEIIGDTESEVFIDEINYNDQERITRTNLLVDGNMDSLAGWIFEKEEGEPDYFQEENESMEHDKCIGTKICSIRNANKVNTMKQIIEKSGVKNESYLLSVFLKCDYIPISASNSNKIYIKFLCGSEEDLYEFPIDASMKTWQVFAKTVASKISYNRIEVGIKFLGLGILSIDNFQLIRDISTTYYQYDEKYNITEVLESNGNNLSLKYDDKNKITFISSKNNQGIYYFYDLNGKLERIKNSKGAMIQIEYDDDDIDKQIFTINGTTQYIINSNYDSNGNEIYNSVNNSSIIRREFNTLGELAKVININNVSINYEYNIYQEVSSISSIVNNEGYINTMIYNNYGQTKKITSNDGIEYLFNYDSLGKLLSVSMNGETLYSLQYEDIENGINTGLETKKTYSQDDYYIFEYDELKKLKKIKYYGNTIVELEYDENGHISKINDNENNRTKYYTYDSKGLLIKVIEDNKIFRYEYDNLNNIQTINYNLVNQYKHIEYEHSYERDKISFEYYVNKMYTKYNKEIVTAASEGNGYKDLTPVTNTAETIRDNGLNVFNFNKNNQIIKYEFNNYVLEPNTRSNNILTRGAVLDDVVNMSAKPIMALWIKPKVNSNNDDSSLIGYTNLVVAENSYETFKLALDENGYLHIIIINQYYSEDKVADIPMKWDKWNYLVIEDSKIYLNGKNEIFNDSFSVGTLNRICIGEQEIYNELSTRCSFEVAFIMYGKYEQETNINIDYVDGLKALKQNTASIVNKTTYLETEFNNKYEVFTMNGNLLSNRNNALLCNMNKDNLIFEYDQELKQYVYSAYSYRDSSLTLLPKIKSKGLLSIKFKLDGLSDYASLSTEDETYPFNESSRFIMSYGNLIIYLVNDYNLEIFSFDGNSVVQCGELECDRWYTLTIFNGDENSGNTTIFLDDTLLVSYLNLQFGLSSKLYIGTSNLNKAQMEGWFSSLVIKDEVVPIEDRSLVLNELLQNHKIEYIQNNNALGRLNFTSIIVNNGTPLLTNVYSYSSVKLTQELVPQLNEKRAYSYDDMNNIVRIVKTSSLGNKTYLYSYDDFGRLTNLNDGDNNTEIKYDDKGNVKSRTQTQLSTHSMSRQETFIYDNLKRLRILSINNSDGLEQVELQYDGLNPVNITRTLNGATQESNNIVYEGKRIRSIGNVLFHYNEEGVRIKKEVYLDSDFTILDKEYEYVVEGDKILSEIAYSSSSSYRLDYNYDMNGLLVSVELDGNTFYYVRDALGNINHIIDKNRNVMVSYEYNEWGKVRVINRVPSCPIGDLNPFIYKGYYYDVETQLFYCNSRYYSPELCRFISPDSIEYLDPQSINGLNLYCYCMNNPIMYADPSGHMPEWAMWLVGGVLLAGSIALTIATWGAASGTILASVKAIAIGATISGITSAAIGTVAGGISYENGVASWDWSGAAEGFMWGSITGVISGAAGSALSNVGSGLATYGKLGKLGYAGIQGLINSGIAGGLTAGQGLITGSFSLDSVGLSAMFGFAGGAIGITKWGEGVRNIIVGAGLGLGESSIGEIIEWWQSRQQTNMAYLRFAY